MKKNSYYHINAIVTQFVNHFEADEIAERIAKNIGDPSVHVDEAKYTGYRFKIKRESSIDESDIVKAIIKSMVQLIDEDNNGFDIEIVERFEFLYDPAMINEELVQRTMTIKRDQKKLYIEIDI